MAELEDSDQMGSLLVETWKYAYSGIMKQSVPDGLSVQKRADRWKHILEKGPELYVLSQNTGGLHCHIGKQ